MLLTGEYLVLDGAQAFAVPLRQGQEMKVTYTRGCDLLWESRDANDEKWFKTRISLFDFKAIKSTDEALSEKLSEILEAACQLNSDFLSTWKGVKVKTRLDFPRHFGWGSSSSLIYCVSKWADVDPFELNELTFGGSGYDIACAASDKPIMYNLRSGKRIEKQMDWHTDFLDQLYLVHLEKKVNSTEEVKKYRKLKKENIKARCKEITALTRAFYEAAALEDLCKIMDEHEAIISEVLDTETIKNKFFVDLKGSAKSLGAWGGDFALIASPLSEKEIGKYCKQQGFSTVYKFTNIVKLSYAKTSTST